MSVPGLVVLYGGVMQKRWSVNSMMLSFVAFAVVLVAWVLWGFKMGFGMPWHGLSDHGFFGTFVGRPGSVLGHTAEQARANIPLLNGGMPQFRFPQTSLVYFQFVFAAITPILMLGSVLGRVNFKAWIPFVALWMTCVYCIDAFLIWGGGYFAHHGAIDYSGGYVIHLSAGVSGFVAAAVIGPRLARDREIDAPNNLAMVALGAGLLWLGWNGFNGGDPYFAGANAAAAVLNTNLSTAVAFLVWVLWDYVTHRKPSMIGSVNGMIVGLVAITPAAGFVNGYGALAIGVIYTHGFAGLMGGLMVAVFADPKMLVYLGIGKGSGFSATGLINGNWVLLKWQALTALFVIAWSAGVTYLLLKFVGRFVSLRMSEEDMEAGDVAVHGHEVYPSDIPSLALPTGIPGWVAVPIGSAASKSGAAREGGGTVPPTA
jgi:Amt family ammonium transporter